ncbi:phage tail sheath subtilisin-like domain-containing protein [Ornithinimicrobium murale]|uniref:phage tail sheath subtilisin-like domain-containing protein n=1 Tax=Ornithinimicrobium murale TaxID=1050153 RepID=UPI000E0CCFF8|nr:phage tail sheath subtilisin-like domain-containing protein [Ornithinimicrobium murale]
MAPDDENPVPTRKAVRTPGVYIEDVPRLAALHIEALPRTVIAFVGECNEGPVGEPVTVTSAAEHHARFGPSLDARRPLGHAVDLFFANGGASALVVRTEGPDVVEGMHALDGTGCTVLVLPGITTEDTEQVTEALASASAYSAVLLLDLPHGPWEAAQGHLAGVGAHRERAAAYHPWVVVDGVAVPPAGAVAGVIARTDRERGVWKAAAGQNAQVHGIAGLTEEVDRGGGEAMMLAGVNELRDFGEQGVLVWGVRTLAATALAEPQQRYLPMRRLLDHVQRSVQEALAGMVFEDGGDEDLWLRIRSGVEAFLDGLWRAGALQGQQPRSAYYVQCGLGQTMTAQDVANGQVIVEWGMAISRPAEFAVSRCIGETEKNLDRVLGHARRVDRVLLFDEADALFGRRTEGD